MNNDNNIRDSAKVAIYWDFENLHAVLTDCEFGPDFYRDHRMTVQTPVVDVEPVLDYAASLGDVIIHRAYGNWQFFSRYRDALNGAGMDLIQMFPRGANMKNSADIRMALDALGDIYAHPHLTHIVVVSSDSDFISLAQKAKQAGKFVAGVGVERNSNRFWIASCNEFKFYSALVKLNESSDLALNAASIHAPAAGQSLLQSDAGRGPTERAAAGASAMPGGQAGQGQGGQSGLSGDAGHPGQSGQSGQSGQFDPNQPSRPGGAYVPRSMQVEEARDVLVKSMTQLVARNGENYVHRGALKSLMKRLMPAFDERALECASFTHFLDMFPEIVRFIDADGGGHVALIESPTQQTRQPSPPQSEAQTAQQQTESIGPPSAIETL